ncbi:hypothetical protein AVV48_gp82 [Acinetobacter phage phiAC-1]|uniref:hypothetical protein n=1 Tax=Acinetobacter phage phiAC-1 TaxID=1229760 RepID=UPI00028B15D6|nr:hypothetical protein AVV48_gp82 [Acinetobacter phage phiAC-1]AFU62331.1 hypothetical protein phiAC-1_0082 [Acinetobacter phage phiAC-1]
MNFEQWFLKRHGTKTDDFSEEFANYTYLKHELKKAWDYQQEKHNAVLAELSNIYDACDEDETVASILDKIQEILR